MKFLLVVAGATILALSPMYVAPALAHGGGLNAEGCHNNRKTGDYHCHRGSSSGSTSRSRPSGPAKVLSKATRSGGAYANCTAARAAGAAPVMRGEPGYGPHLDRDNDGIGCE
jgi:hypothetical protein